MKIRSELDGFRVVSAQVYVSIQKRANTYFLLPLRVLTAVFTTSQLLLPNEKLRFLKRVSEKRRRDLLSFKASLRDRKPVMPIASAQYTTPKAPEPNSSSKMLKAIQVKHMHNIEPCKFYGRLATCKIPVY